MRFISIINEPGKFWDENRNKVVEFAEIVNFFIGVISPEELLSYSLEYAKVDKEVNNAVILWRYTPQAALVEDLCSITEEEGWAPVDPAMEDAEVEIFYYGGYVPVTGLPGTPPDASIMQEVEHKVLKAIEQRKLDREASQQAWEKGDSLKKDFFSQLQTGDQWTYISHDSEGVKFQVGDRIITVGAAASMVNYDQCEASVVFSVEEA